MQEFEKRRWLCFIASLIIAVVVTKLTPAPNAEAVEIFDKATSKDAD